MLTEDQDFRVHFTHCIEATSDKAAAVSDAGPAETRHQYEVLSGGWGL